MFLTFDDTLGSKYVKLKRIHIKMVPTNGASVLLKYIFYI